MKYADITRANAEAAAEKGLIPALEWTIAKYRLYSRCSESRWKYLEVYGYHADFQSLTGRA